MLQASAEVDDGLRVSSSHDGTLQESGSSCINGEMYRLDWIRSESGWRAGRYHIELAAPGLWVCSRTSSRHADHSTIEMTSGSLSALKARVEKLEGRRRDNRRCVVYMLATLVAMLGVGLGASWDAAASSLVVLGFSLAGIVCFIRAIDAIVQRSWQALNLTYQ